MTLQLDAAVQQQDAEAVLLQQLQAQDERAYEALVRAHSGRLLAVARRILRNEEDACDAVQDAFISAFRALPTFNGQSRLTTWLHRIVINAALLKIRARSRRPEGAIDDLLPRYLEDGHRAEPVTPFGASVEELLMQREVRARVREAIDRLPESYRTIVLLRDIEELDTEEAASMLGLTPNAVKVRLHRARQALAKLIAPAATG